MYFWSEYVVIVMYMNYTQPNLSPWKLTTQWRWWGRLC